MKEALRQILARDRSTSNGQARAAHSIWPHRLAGPTSPAFTAPLSKNQRLWCFRPMDNEQAGKRGSANGREPSSAAPAPGRMRNLPHLRDVRRPRRMFGGPQGNRSILPQFRKGGFGRTGKGGDVEATNWICGSRHAAPAFIFANWTCANLKRKWMTYGDKDQSS